MRVVLLLGGLLVMCLLPSKCAKAPKEHKWTIENTNYTLNTTTYKTVGFIGHLTSLVFAVKGSRDGHVMLSHSQNLTAGNEFNLTAGYEFVIGGGQNRVTFFRYQLYLRGYCCWEQRWKTMYTMKAMPNWLHSEQYRWFWLDWSDGYHLKAGTGDNPGDPSTTIMFTKATFWRNSLRFLSFSALGNTVYYKIVKDRYPCFLRIEDYKANGDNNCPHKLQGVHYQSIYNPSVSVTPTNYKTIGYIGSSTSLLVRVKGERDGHIALSTTQDLTTNIFEYVLGGASDRETLVRTPIGGRLLDIYYQYYTMSDSSYQWFWFDWSNGLTLRAGRRSNPADCQTKALEITRNLLPGAIPRFLSVSANNTIVKYIGHLTQVKYKVPKASNRCYLSLDEYNNRKKCGKNLRANAKKCVSLGCCWDSQAKFCYMKPKGEYSWSIHNPNNKMNYRMYETIGYIGGMTLLRIEIKGDRDGHVVLTRSQTIGVGSHNMEWVIDGDNKKETRIRSPINGRVLAYGRSNRYKITSKKYSIFWLEWSTSHLRVGEGSLPDNTSQWMSVERTDYGPNCYDSYCRDHKYVAVSAYGNTVQYKITKSLNRCFLTVEEFRTRVVCGDSANQSRCHALHCCWDRFYDVCYFPSSG